MSSDYRVRTLRRALNATPAAALSGPSRPIIGTAAVKQHVDYTWRLRQVMATHGMFATTELVQPLRDRGIDLSVSQVHRLVTGTPERLSMRVLAALCDIFDTTPDELITTSAGQPGRAGAEAGPDHARCARPVRLGWQQAASERDGKRVWVAVRRWPDGYICSGCSARSVEQ